MKLSVGNVVYVLDKKTQAVVPCQLVERISSVTLNGEVIKNIASTPSGKKFVLEEYVSPWFENYDLAHEYLRNAALDLVKNTMNKAKEVAIKTFGHDSFNSKLEVKDNSQHADFNDSSSDENPTTLALENHDEVLVDIGGQQVKVTLPKEYTVNE
jgi:hypothetical protein